MLLSDGVLNFRNGHLWARNKVYAICECVYQVRFKVTCRSGTVSDIIVTLVSYLRAGDTPSSRHVSSCDVNACSLDVSGDLTLNSMAQIHTSVTLLPSRDPAWSSGRLTCQHAYQISAVAHIS
jgi:hypothetical protein